MIFPDNTRFSMTFQDLCEPCIVELAATYNPPPPEIIWLGDLITKPIATPLAQIGEGSNELLLSTKSTCYLVCVC